MNELIKQFNFWLNELDEVELSNAREEIQNFVADVKEVAYTSGQRDMAKGMKDLMKYNLMARQRVIYSTEFESYLKANNIEV